MWQLTTFGVYFWHWIWIEVNKKLVAALTVQGMSSVTHQWWHGPKRILQQKKINQTNHDKVYHEFILLLYPVLLIKLLIGSVYTNKSQKRNLMIRLVYMVYLQIIYNYVNWLQSPVFCCVFHATYQTWIANLQIQTSRNRSETNYAKQ